MYYALLSTNCLKQSDVHLTISLLKAVVCADVLRFRKLSGIQYYRTRSPRSRNDGLIDDEVLCHRLVLRSADRRSKLLRLAHGIVLGKFETPLWRL